MSAPVGLDEVGRGVARVASEVLGTEATVDGLELLAGGASRQTWAFTATAGGRRRELVLRTGSLEGRDAGMQLEAACLRAAARAGVPVPAVLGAADDGGPLGTGYLVAERVEGEAIPRRILRATTTADRRRLLDDCAGALAGVHSVDPRQLPGLETHDPVERWREELDEIGTPSPAFELALRWLDAHRPPSARAAVVHGDFRLGNLVVGGRGLAAVLDWELVHAGDPLEDLGWFCVRAWRFGEDEREAGGLGDLEDLVGAYEQAAGTEVDRSVVRWWQVLGTLRWGVLCGRQVLRHLSGATRSVELAAVGRRVCENEWDVLSLLSAQGWPR